MVVSVNYAMCLGDRILSDCSGTRLSGYLDNIGCVSAKPNPKTCVFDLSLRPTLRIFVYRIFNLALVRSCGTIFNPLQYE